MKKIILSLLFCVPLLLSAQTFDVPNSNSIFFAEDADGQGGDIGIADSLFLGWTGSGFRTIFDTLGRISKYNNVVPAAGSILYGNGSYFTPLSIGTAGQVLKVNVGATAPEWSTPGAGGATAFTELSDAPGSYSGKARKFVTVNAAETGLEFTSQIQESDANLRIGSSTAYGSLYNIVIGEGSKTGASSSRNTYIGYQINNAATSDGENTIIGPSTLAVNATTQTIVGTVVNHARISGMVAIGSYMTLPTTGTYSFPTSNSPIYIGYNINNSETAPATKSNIFIGKNISTSGFTSSATTNAIIIAQNPTLEDGLQNAIGIGQEVSFLDGEPNSVAIGNFATIYNDPTYGSGGGQSVAIGLYAKAGSWRSLSLGAYAQALAVSSTAIGYGSYSNKPHSDTWGRGGYNDLEGATLLYGSPSTGSTNIGDFYFGAIAAKHLNPAMPGGGETLDLSTELNAGTAYVTLTTTTGRDATAVPSLTDTRGGEFRFMGGASTGTANGGDLVFGVTLAGGVSNNTVNTWDEALRIKGSDGHLYINLTPDTDNSETNVLVRDASTGEIEERAVSTIAYTDEAAQDAVGAMIDGSLGYTDGTPLLQRAALTGDVTASAGSNTTAIAAGVIVNADINASAAIDATKIGAGGVTSTEFGYVGTLTSDAQTQLNNKGFTIVISGSQASVGDAATYYSGITQNNSGTTADVNRIYIPVNCTLVAGYGFIVNNGIGGTSGESGTFYARKNDATDVTISASVTTNATKNTFSGTGLSTSFSAGDYVEGKWLTPNYATNPTNCRWTVVLYFIPN